jgi:hypothetical protein
MTSTQRRAKKRGKGKIRKHPATYRLTALASAMLYALSNNLGISMASIVELAVREHCSDPGKPGPWDPSEDKLPGTYRMTPESIGLIVKLCESYKKHELKVPISAIVENAVRRYYDRARVIHKLPDADKLLKRS